MAFRNRYLRHTSKNNTGWFAHLLTRIVGPHDILYGDRGFKNRSRQHPGPSSVPPPFSSVYDEVPSEVRYEHEVNFHSRSCGYYWPR
jgi:hypothetical protein